MMKYSKEKLKVAFVSFQKDAERVPPIGLVYLATYLKEKKGIKNVRIIDKNFDDIEKELIAFSPDLICVTAMTVHYMDVIRFAEYFKRKSNRPIIIGGVHISTLPISFKPCFDIGVIGEGEETLGELVDIYIKKEKFDYKDLKKIEGVIFLHDGEIIINKKRQDIELDILPIPDFDLVNKEYFSKQEIPGPNLLVRRAFILTSRSCPYKCKFCSTSHFWGKVRFHSPEYTAKLIKHNMGKYNATYIKILDDLFTVNLERLKNIKTELEKLGILDKIEGMECSPRANLINDDLCQVMRELKVKIVNFGFESGSERMLNWLKGESVTVDMNRNAIVLCKKYGFTVYGSLIFASPGEKIEDMEETLKFIDFAIENNIDYLWSFIGTPFPDTPFWNIALERKKVNKDMDFSTLSHHNLDNPLLLDEDVDKEKFKEIFILGRKKLRKLKIKLMLNFFKHHPLATIKLFAKSPRYYASRVIKQVYKH